MVKVDINCDMGESFGLYQLGNDAEMMRYITSANIACGFHGGDPHVMRKTIEMAKAHGVKIGSHPAFPDLMGFGRRYLKATPSEIKDYVTYQTGALREFASAYNLTIQHCKPHGALYMMAMEDEQIARAILEAIADINDKTLVYAMNNSAVAGVAEEMGIPVAMEVYSDREHTATGSIIMTRRGSEIADYQKMADRVVRMVTEGVVTTDTGEDIPIISNTVCIHGDTPGAPELAKAIVSALKAADVQITNAQDVLGLSIIS